MSREVATGIVVGALVLFVIGSGTLFDFFKPETNEGSPVIVHGTEYAQEHDSENDVGDGVPDIETLRSVSLEEYLESPGTGEKTFVGLESIDDVSPTELTSIKKYGNALGFALINPLPPPEEQVSIFSIFIESNNEQARADFLSLVEMYELTIEEISKINPPTAAQDVHARVLGAYQNLVSAMFVLAKNYNKTPESVVEYNTAAPAAIAALSDVARLMRVYGVKFDKTDPGSLFTL